MLKSRRVAMVLLLPLLLAPAACGSLRSELEIARAAAVSGMSEASLETTAGPVVGGDSEPDGGASDNAAAATTTTAPATQDTTGTSVAVTAPTEGADPADVQPAEAAVTGPATGSVIRVGHIGNYSGIVGGILKGGDAAIQVWASHVNDNGGLNGHRVEVITGDDQGDPARALQLTREMVENQGAVAFVGNNMPLSASGARAYLEERQIPVIGGDGASPTWYESPMYFANSPSYYVLGQGTTRAAVAQGLTKIAVAYCGEAPACTVFDRAVVDGEADGGYEVVYRAEISLAQPDFTAECIQGRDSGAEAFVLGMESGSISRFARSCAQQGYHPLLLTAGLATTNSLAEDPNADGIIAPLATFPWMATDTPAAQEYQDAMAAYAPGLESAGATTGAWASGMLLRAASANLPEGDVSSADLLAGLWALQGENVGGLAVDLSYTQGQPAPDPQCYFLGQISGGTWVAPQGSTTSCL